MCATERDMPTVVRDQAANAETHGWEQDLETMLWDDDCDPELEDASPSQ